jgi:lactoylglutathione lyase
VVFEIYPAPADEPPVTSVRLGFTVAALDRLLETLLDAGGKLISEPLDSPSGRRAVVADPEGRRLELTEPRGPRHCCG